MQVLLELSTYSMNVFLSPLNLVFFLIIYIRRILTGCKIKPFLSYHIISSRKKLIFVGKCIFLANKLFVFLLVPYNIDFLYNLLTFANFLLQMLAKC